MAEMMDYSLAELKDMSKDRLVSLGNKTAKAAQNAAQLTDMIGSAAIMGGSAIAGGYLSAKPTWAVQGYTIDKGLALLGIIGGLATGRRRVVEAGFGFAAPSLVNIGKNFATGKGFSMTSAGDEAGEISGASNLRSLPRGRVSASVSPEAGAALVHSLSHRG